MNDSIMNFWVIASFCYLFTGVIVDVLCSNYINLKNDTLSNNLIILFWPCFLTLFIGLKIIAAKEAINLYMMRKTYLKGTIRDSKEGNTNENKEN